MNSIEEMQLVMRYLGEQPNIPTELQAASYPEEFLSCYKVLDFGATKYGANSWLKAGVINEKDCFASINRHIAAAMTQGVLATDDESKLLHLEHAACRINMLITLAKRGVLSSGA